MKELQGKNAIITGGSRGIGRACCLAFAQAGANVIFTYNKNKDEADKLEKELKPIGVKTFSFQLDVKNADRCRELVEKTLEKFKRLDILLNNAGIVKDKALMMMMPEDWKDVIDTNLGGVFNLTRASIVTFLKQKSGCIINMSSVSGLTGVARQTNYSASKAGIIGFSKSLAKEVAAYGVRVNVVCPGYIETDMVDALKPELKKEFLNYIPVKRFGKPREVADLCVFLASEKAAYITGEVIKVDGGLVI
ncbi:MAG: 3-oxoacyl-[acyl-carrier-protein] reductase [Candidatus Omnitrophota bacterium]